MSVAAARRSRSGARARATAPLAWRRAGRGDLARLHARYLTQVDEPFFVEISGPDVGMPLAAFASWCADAATMWVAGDGARLDGFLWLSYLQPSIGVANVDWSFVDGAAPVGPRRVDAFRATLEARCRELGLRKLHLFALPHQSPRIELARRLGFVEEGTLESHFFHAGRLQSLLCLGRTS